MRDPRSDPTTEPGLLAGLGRDMEPLERAMAIQRRCASVGFDWNAPQGAREKVSEELAELDAAMASGDQVAVAAELGDLLLAVTNLARLLGVDPAGALHEALDRFQARFALVEAHVRASGRNLHQVDLETLEGYWQAAKRNLHGRE